MVAIVSAVAFTFYLAWAAYTPVADRVSDVGYYSFSGLFAFNFVPVFFIFIILGVSLSLVIDRLVLHNFNLKGMRGILIMVTAYVVLGVISGVIVAVVFFGVNFINVSLIKFLFLTIFGALIFLVVQTVFLFSFYKFAK
ncbi:hypothetical protein KH400_06030 [Desertibacillus haloalkaliphilus]|nr:hypothetical protein [Desertibacillus haloalkaliphilus]